MYSLVNSNFNRTYNPISRQNALSEIKRLLTSRDTVGQTKACNYILEVIKRYNVNSEERARLLEYLLDNDIVVFLCEATSNLSFSLFRLVLECIRLLWSDRRFFIEEHAAHAMAAVLRSLAHYSATDTLNAVELCLSFLCDLLNGISSSESLSALSYQSTYTIEQLFACLHNLTSRVCGKPKTILSCALVLDALISYQPKNLDLRAATANKLCQVLKQWLEVLLGGMNHIVLMDDDEKFGLFLTVTSQLGSDILRLIKVLDNGRAPADFVQTILVNENDIQIIKQCSLDMKNSVLRVISEIVVLVKENQEKIDTDDYSMFLKFLLNFLTDNITSGTVADFCDVLVTNGYLSLLPKSQIQRCDKRISKLSTLILGETLKILSEKYLVVNEIDCSEPCSQDIHMGLVDLQYGIEKPQSIGIQLQKGQPYSLLIYMYFYFQSLENPEDCTALLLPHLVDHILSLPESFKPPLYIIKALWLVFAIATVSNGASEALDKRVALEKAIDRIVLMLQPDPTIFYTHNPAIMLWAFTSPRIPYSFTLNILSQWLKTENTLPEDLIEDSSVWELLLNILIQNNDNTTISNCMDTLNFCLDKGDDCTRQDFANLTWSLLPGILSKTLIDSDNVINSNICYLLEIATTQFPNNPDHNMYQKVSVLITTLVSKSNPESMEVNSKYRNEYASFKLCLILLKISQDQNDSKVLLSFTNRLGFLPNVLLATDSSDDKVACTALQLLTYIVFYFNKNKYHPKDLLQIETDGVIKSLRRDSVNERGVSLLKLMNIVLCSTNTPLVLTKTIKSQPSGSEQCDAFQALLFRVQQILCYENVESETPLGWKTLNSIFKHAIGNDSSNLVATLINQPWLFLLIRFQITQNVSTEFLSFTHNWLSLLKIATSKCREVKNTYFSKYSIIIRTLVLIKKHLIREETNEGVEKILMITNEILTDCMDTDEF